MSKTLVEPYVFFSGRCQEALDFYTQAIGAEVASVIHYKDSPEPAPPGMLPPGYENKVMHALFRVGGSAVMCSDGCGEEPGFRGFKLTYSVATEAEAERAFAALSEGGQVNMPLTKTFWSPKFGMLTDKFGLEWMVMTMPQ